MNSNCCLPKTFSVYIVIICVLLLSTNCIWSSTSSSVLSCPHLKPNKNALVICYTETTEAGGKNRQFFKCDLNNAPGYVNISTTAVYQCDRYYKSAGRRLKQGGKLHCTENGWTNLQGFKDFHCELECGKQRGSRLPLLNSGNDANPKIWPWVATIYKKNKRGLILYTCGGTLIGLRTVLTAAHCVYNDESTLKVVLGTISSDFEQNGANFSTDSSVCEVQETIIHAGYNPLTLANDIAIIELEEPVTLSDSVLPICLPLSFEQDSVALSPGKFGEIASFGTDGSGLPTKTLQYARIGILSNADCNEQIKIIPKKDQYCAGNYMGPSICRGDSGSGMFFKLIDGESKYVVHGIVSNTAVVKNGCAAVVIFPKVFTYIKWILDISIAAENRELDESHLQSAWIYENPEPKDRNPVPTQIMTTKPQIQLNSTKTTDSSLPRYTDEEKSALIRLKPLISNLNLDTFLYNDDYLLRFLRAEGFNLEETRETLKANADWRKRNKVDGILGEDFSEYIKNYTVLFQGVDNEGRQVVTRLIGSWDLQRVIRSGTTERFQRYLIRNFEESALRARNSDNTQLVTIFDLYGFNRRQHLCLQCLRLYIYFVRTYEDHYPQATHMAFIINMPDMFQTVLDVIQPMFSEHTRNSIRFFGTSKDVWSKELLKYIPNDQLFKAYGGTKLVTKGVDKFIPFGISH